MPLSDCLTLKELAAAYQPLVLAQFVLPGGAVLRASSHSLSVAEGGPQYNSQNWTGRILNYDMTASQVLADQGIDSPPSVTVKLADPDRVMYREYEQAIGFKGAALTLILVFWNAGTTDFSSDSIVKFTGKCGSGQQPDDTSLTCLLYTSPSPRDR